LREYGLTSQARRAAASAPANIAEGSGSRTRPEFCRFLLIAIKSLRELGYWLTLARDLEYVTPAIWEDLEKQRGDAGYLLWRLYQSLSK
jgi:four helix bundle protein